MPQLPANPLSSMEWNPRQLILILCLILLFHYTMEHLPFFYFLITHICAMALSPIAPAALVQVLGSCDAAHANSSELFHMFHIGTPSLMIYY